MTQHTGPWDEMAWYGMDVPATMTTTRPDLDVVYGGGLAFDPTRLLAEDYLGGPVAVRGRAMDLLGKYLHGPSYRLILHALAAGLEIGRIDVHWPRHAGISVLPELLPILPKLRPGCDAVPGLRPGTAELRRRFPDPPPVTVLYQGLQPELTLTDWPADRLHVKPYKAGLEAAWREAETDFLVLLAPGMQPQGPDWLRALMTLAVEDGTGLAGATPDALVQHETLVLPFVAVATRCAVLAEMSGVDSRYSSDMAVADLCLRLRQVGLRIAGTPHAAVTGPTRPAPSGGDLSRLRLTWQAILRPEVAGCLPPWDQPTD
jgi:hypothetical protein